MLEGARSLYTAGLPSPRSRVLVQPLSIGGQSNGGSELSLYGWARVPAEQGISPAAWHWRVKQPEGASSPCTAGLACPRSRVLVQPLCIGGKAMEGAIPYGHMPPPYNRVSVQPPDIARYGYRRERYPMGACPFVRLGSRARGAGY